MNNNVGASANKQPRGLVRSVRFTSMTKSSACALLNPDKKLYAVITDLGGFGAYYIAAAADEVYADRPV